MSGLVSGRFESAFGERCLAGKSEKENIRSPAPITLPSQCTF